jgi:hypothetical protein
MIEKRPVAYAAALFLAALALAADESVDLTGTWLLDKSRSDAPRIGRWGLGGGFPGGGFPGRRGGGFPSSGGPDRPGQTGGQMPGDVTLVVEQNAPGVQAHSNDHHRR